MMSEEIIAVICDDIDGECTVQATSNREEIKQLLSVGFEYMCQKDDIMQFRKRK